MSGGQLHVVHHFPGRLRVRARPFRESPELAGQVAAAIGEEPGVLEVRTSEITGSLVIVYQPHRVQLPRLIQRLLAVSGLPAVEVDDVDRWQQRAPGGEQLRRALDALNEKLRAASRGALDLRTAGPGALVGLGLTALLFGKRLVPNWYDLLFWGFDTFVNLNPPAQTEAARPDARG
jgi:hypothetical protein